MVVSVTSTCCCASIQSATAFGPWLSSSWRVPAGGVSVRVAGGRGARLGGRARAAVGLGMAVHRDVGDVGEDLGRPVAALLEAVELGRVVDELGGVAEVEELRVLQQVLDEGDVGRDAADAELAQRPVDAGDRHLGRRRPGGDLFEQAVVVAGDHRAGIGGAAVEPDAEAGGAAIGGDAAVVGDEVVLGILGGDAALDGVAVQHDVGLPGHAGGLGDGRALGDQDLGAHDVDAGDLLGHGVLDLDAGIDLDEVEGAGVAVHQELDGAGAFVVGVAGDLQAELAELSRWAWSGRGRGRVRRPSGCGAGPSSRAPTGGRARRICRRGSGPRRGGR
jgi:hypothetical protein